jgi:tRNA-dihydrouridine synthase A
VVEALLPYIDHQLQKGIPLNRITRHILGLFLGCPGAKKWRRILSEASHKKGADSRLVSLAAAQVAPLPCPTEEIYQKNLNI